MTAVEQRSPHDDAVDRVVGTYRFAIDRRIEGALAGRVVRSMVPHGRITELDTSGALQVEGVVAVVTGADLMAADGIDPMYGEVPPRRRVGGSGDDDGPASAHVDTDPARPDQPVLAVDRVRYVGEPVALVLAEDQRAADAGAEQVFVDYESLPFVEDPVAAGEEGAPLVHEHLPNNECAYWTLRHGDIEQGWREAERVYEHEYWSPTASHVPMEPHVATARWTDGRLEVWSGTQGPHTVKTRLARIFGMDEGDIRIRGDNLGGGFGSKCDAKLEPLVACAAKVVGRPVRLALRSDEVFVTIAKHSARVRIKTGVKLDGTIVARHVRVEYNAGAYAVSSPRAARTGMLRAPGPYRIPHVWVDSIARHTNTVPTGPFRGAMTGQICWAHESTLDEIAADLEIDPLEMRLRNVLREGDEYATGETMHDVAYPELLDAVAEGIDWNRPSDPPSEPNRVRGKGIALVLKSTRTPSRSEAGVRLGDDGGWTVLTSSVEMGQGSQATLATLAAEELGVEPGSVRVSLPDTDHTPYDPLTSSSRTTFFMGNAVRDAARRFKAEIAALAAERLGVDPGVFDHDGGALVHGAERVAYHDVLGGAGRDELTVLGSYESPPGYGELDPETAQGVATIHWHQGCVGVEVEVDVETGRVHLLRAHGASYAGRVVDPLRVRKQTEGGMVFGMGQALMEELTFDEGQVTNPNLSDYLIPSILDAPVRITSTALGDQDADAEPHGVGENTVPPMGPAVANAVFRATGARVRTLPVSAERVLTAIEDTRSGGQR